MPSTISYFAKLSLVIYSFNLKIQSVKPETVCACVGLTVPGWGQSLHVTGMELNYSCKRDFKVEAGPRSSNVEFGPLAKSRTGSHAEPAGQAGMELN